MVFTSVPCIPWAPAARNSKAATSYLSIDGHDLNPYGRYLHEEYDRVSFEHLILQKMDGEMIPFENLGVTAKKLTLDVAARNVKADEMLVPYYFI